MIRKGENMAIQFIPTKCPTCNGQLDIDIENKKAVCKYCQSSFLIADTNDGVTRVEIVNAEQAGIDFGKGLEAAKKKEEKDKGKAEPFGIKSNNNAENFTLSEPPSNIGSAESIKNLKLSDSFIWKKEFIDGSYIINTPCINLIKTAPLDFGFSFYHIIKGDYQLYLNHCLINMRNARLILKVFINKHNVYSLKNFPSNDLIEQFESSQSEKSPIIKLKEYLICSITKKMFDDVCNLEKNENNETTNDFEIRVVFQNIDLFWKAGWCIDGGRLLRKVYEINESNKNSDFKRFKSDNIDINVVQKYEENQNIKLRGMKNKKRNSVGEIPNIFS